MKLELAAALAFILMLGLFLLAAIVEQRSRVLAQRPRMRHTMYTLALGVYCSSWTFYGAVGSIARDGWSYLPIYIGPILLLLCAPTFLQKLSEAVAKEQATTVSDFIAARFGHDIVVARLVTTIALLGTIPYLALQLRSMGAAISLVTNTDATTLTMLVAAPLFALFAILFGTRRFEVAGRSEGLVYAIGVESVLKIAALVIVAMLACFLLYTLSSTQVSIGFTSLKQQFHPESLSIHVIVILVLSSTAILTLPRQFYMGLVEAKKPDDLLRARFGLAFYLAAMALVIIPIAWAGRSFLGESIAPDLYVLRLPADSGFTIILGIALLGGISAAASMAIVDSTALATMVSNDLIFPTLIRRSTSQTPGILGRRVLIVRRLAILVILSAASLWALLLSEAESLASIGLVAFAAMAQFTPHFILAALGDKRDALAARASLSIGLFFWLYTLALPPILPLGIRESLAGSLLDPYRLLGIGNASPLTHGVFWSLGINLLVYTVIAARNFSPPPLSRFIRMERPVTTLSELIHFTSSFIGKEQAEREFSSFTPEQLLNRHAVNKARTLIAQIVGASSARALITSALAGDRMSLQDVTRLLDEGTSLRFSRHLLASTFENIDSGISVVDADLNLIAWNNRYLETFNYPAGMVRVGVPIATLIRYNAQHGDFGSGDVEFHVAKRLEHLRRGKIHAFERKRNDSRVIKTVGGPMPGGGYVMSFTDITEEARIREELRETLDAMEHRVMARTQELQRVNAQLARADHEKTRFLAAASHDLLQPLHAARLFTAALDRSADASQHQLVQRVESAIVAAENLLKSLLDISRLDAGGITPQITRIDLADLLTDLAETFRPDADQRELRLVIGPLYGSVRTDIGLLRSIVQNFLSNALRYTQQGGVLLGVRSRGKYYRIDVIDTGVGIAEHNTNEIFNEFTRLGEVDAEGFGLGLALVQRTVRLLGGKVEVHSKAGIGSRFSVYLPKAPRHKASTPSTRPALNNGAEPQALEHKRRILVLDDDERIVEASLMLLDSLGHEAHGVRDRAGVLAFEGPLDAVFVDYQLQDNENGLDLLALLRQRYPHLPALLITAENSPEMQAQAAALNVAILTKPAPPEAIQAFLARL